MLREELKNSDIPGRSTMRARIMELLDQHLDQLEHDFHVSVVHLPLQCSEYRTNSLRHV